MEIQYLMNIHRHGSIKMYKKRRIGIVQQVTPKLIAVKGEKYPETILINDLISGEAKILGLMRGEKKMAGKSPYNWDELGPKIDSLRAEGKTIQKIATELGIAYSTAYRYLNKQEKQAQVSEPVQVASQEPDDATQEPVQDIICEEEEKNNLPERVDEPIYNPEPVKMPIGCTLPLEDTERPDNDNNTVETQIDWPPKDAIERAMIESSVNAQLAVRRVINDPVALALIKELMARGAV